VKSYKNIALQISSRLTVAPFLFNDRSPESLTTEIETTSVKLNELGHGKVKNRNSSLKLPHAAQKRPML
jgi:hypothetical protein